MTIHPGIGMLLVCAGFVALFVALRALRKRGGADPELLRKLLHVGMGMVSLSLPRLFEAAWPALVLAGLFVVGLAGARVLPRWRRFADGVIYGVHRVSVGDLCFPVAVAALFCISEGDPLTFSVPILTMVLPDAAAALVGTRWGTHRFGRPGREKTVEGSAAFFILALPCICLPLRYWTGRGWAAALVLSLYVALLATLVEALSWNGTDNLTVPGAVFLLLRSGHAFDPGSVAVVLAVIIGLGLQLAFGAAEAPRGSPATSEVAHDSV